MRQRSVTLVFLIVVAARNIASVAANRLSTQQAGKRKAVMGVAVLGSAVFIAAFPSHLLSADGSLPASPSYDRDGSPIVVEPAPARDYAGRLAEASVSTAPGIRFGIWFPYVSNSGVPPLASLAAAGIDATLLSGDIDTNVLASYDVLFFGRAAMIGTFPAGAGVIQDMDALVDWVQDGGGVIGESNALLWDSDIWRGTDWSSRLSTVAGISVPRRGFDFGLSNLPVSVVDPAHPVTKGVAPTFTLLGNHAHMLGTVVDNAKNPTTVAVAQVLGEPVSVAEFGAGCVVNFPTAVGFGNMDWTVNPDYERLFINAVRYCGKRVIAVATDIKPGSDPNSINCRNVNGLVPVAILTTADFDATTVDHTTVTFEGAPEIHVGEDGIARRHEEDVDGDGDIDLLLHFRLADSGLTCESAKGTLVGKTFEGQAIEGSDSVRMVRG
jgi:hypothetical protein